MPILCHTFFFFNKNITSRLVLHSPSFDLVLQMYRCCWGIQYSKDRVEYKSDSYRFIMDSYGLHCERACALDSRRI